MDLGDTTLIMHDPLKPRYFKMDDVSYPLRILHRYLPNISRYISGEYPKIKFYFFKKIII